ncbi:MAG: BatD family protein [Lentisphaeria bacterium]|nr:BatD family protein [Lentisphaeria bacterium]
MKHLLAACFLLAGLLLAGADFSVEIEPVRPSVRLGEYVQLALSSPRQIGAVDYPVVKGARWAENFQYSQTRSINGQVSYVRILALIPEKTGELLIPPFTVRSGSDTARTAPVKVRILERKAPETAGGGSVKLTDAVRGRILLSPERKEYYTGEEITLFCDLLVDERIARQIRVNYYPTLENVGGALFTTWETRAGKVRFQAGRPVQVEEKDLTFLRYRFTAVCRVMKPGEFAPGAAVSVGVLSGGRRESDPFDDPFGSGFFDSVFSSSRVEPFTVEFKGPAPVKILPLPPVPAGVLDTRLVGSWQATGNLSSASLKQGEVAELTLAFTGKGAAESFSAPKLEPAGFRVYPPEVRKKADSVTAKYALIPLVPGERRIDFAVGTFDPAAGKWRTEKFSFRAAVARSAVPVPTPPPPAAVRPAAPRSAPAPAEAGKSAEPPAETPLLYQKSAPGAVVRTPLIVNTLPYTLVFFFGFPLAAVWWELRARRREREAVSPELRRRHERRKSMQELVKLLKTQGDTPEFRSRLIPLLGEAMDLSAGATPGEIARHTDDPELRRYFADLDSAGFRPGGADAGCALTPKGVKALVKLLKSLMIFAVAFILFVPAEAEPLNAEFNAGQFARAAARYRTLAEAPGGFRPDMLYNYGNAQYALGNYPEARFALNLAALLEPWDHEIRANLNLVNARLFQNGSSGSSLTRLLGSMRDQLRCDQFLMLGAFFWGVLWLLWSFRRNLPGAWFHSLAGVAAFLLLLCLAAGISQACSTYAPDRVIVVAKQVELRTLPGRRSGVVEATLPGGGDAELIQDDPAGFSRIRINGREGWVDSKTVKKALPGGLF